MSKDRVFSPHVFPPGRQHAEPARLIEGKTNLAQECHRELRRREGSQAL